MSGTRTLRVEILGDSRGAEKAFASVSGAAEGFGSKVGKVALVGGAALAGLAVAGAAGALKLGMSFDSAYDTIAAGTGATGDVLKGLEQSFKDVVSTVPTDFGTASEAITQLNQRLGLTGDPLEALATQFINLARVTGTDLSTAIEKGTRVFGDWGIEAEDQAAALDHMFKVTQTTGVGFDQLGEAVVKFGAPLRQLGFSFEESTALIGKFEKEGVNTELVLGSMRIALTRMAKDGEEPIETFGRLTEEIANAGDAGEANAKAIELFGARAGPDMAAAIREGRFSIEELMATLGASEQTINGTAEATDDFGEKFQILKNKALVALEPIGMAALNLANIVVEKLTPAVDKLPGLFSFIGDGVKTFIGALQGDWVSSSGINPVHDAMGRVGSIIHDTVIPAVTSMAAFITDTLAPAVMSFLDNAWAMFQAGMGWVTDTALPSVQGFAESVAGFFNDTLIPAVSGFLNPYWQELQAGFAWLTDTALPAVETFATDAAGFFTDTLTPAVTDFTTQAALGFGALVNEHIPGVVSAFETLAANPPSFAEIGQGIADAFNAAVDASAGVLEALQPLFDAVREAVSTWIPQFQEMWGTLSSSFGNSTPLMQSLGELMTTLGKAASDARPLLEALGVVLATVIVAAVGVLLATLGGLIGFLNGTLPGAIQFATGVIQVFSGVIMGISTLVTGVVDIVSALLRGEWGEAWEAAKQLVSDQVEAMKLIVEGLKNAVIGSISAMIGGVVGLVSGFVDTIVGFFQSLYDQLVGNSIVPDMVDAIIATLERLPSEAVQVVADFVTKAVDKLAELVTEAGTKAADMVAAIVSGLAGLATEALGLFTSFAGEVVGVLSGIDLYSVGVQIVQGLISGLDAKLGELRDKVSEIPGLVNDALGALPGLSPSPYGTMVGKQIVEGLVFGMESQYAALTDAAVQTGMGISQGLNEGLYDAQTSIGTAPSRAAPHPVGVAAGEDFVTGIGVGINANAPAAEEAAYGAGLNVGGGFAEGVQDGLPQNVMFPNGLPQNQMPGVGPTTLDGPGGGPTTLDGPGGGGGTTNMDRPSGQAAPPAPTTGPAVMANTGGGYDPGKQYKLTHKSSDYYDLPGNVVPPPEDPYFFRAWLIYMMKHYPGWYGVHVNPRYDPYKPGPIPDNWFIPFDEEGKPGAAGALQYSGATNGQSGQGYNQSVSVGGGGVSVSPGTFAGGAAGPSPLHLQVNVGSSRLVDELLNAPLRGMTTLVGL